MIRTTQDIFINAVKMPRAALIFLQLEKLFLSFQSSLVSLLLGMGCDVNEANTCGWTSLHHAAFHGHNDTVKVLLKAK